MAEAYPNENHFCTLDRFTLRNITQVKFEKNGVIWKKVVQTIYKTYSIPVCFLNFSYNHIQFYIKYTFRYYDKSVKIGVICKYNITGF